VGEIAPFIMVVLIIAIITFGKLYSAKHGLDTRSRKERRRDGFYATPAGVSLEEASRMKSEITRLNERIQVLERLAVDPGKRLSDQIDALDAKR
jgi:hypothetical protein